MDRKPHVREFAMVDGKEVVNFGDILIRFDDIEGTVEYNKLPLFACRFSFERAVVDALVPESTCCMKWFDNERTVAAKVYDAGGSGFAFFMDYDDGERLALYDFSVITPVPDADFDAISMRIFDAIETAVEHIGAQQPDRVLNTQEAY